MSRKSARIVRLVGSFSLGATSLLVVSQGLAQDGETTTVTVTPPSVSTSSTYVAPGYPTPGTELEGHLPSSSRAVGDISRSSDGFDLSRPSSSATLRGNKGSEVVMSTYRMGVPEVHVVRRGDTLWGLSSDYYRNPHHWPRLWSYNPQIQNPHWIYPGDQIRMRLGGGPTAVSGFIDRRAAVPANTIFLRDQGYIDDPKRDVWGELVGASEDQMLLSDGNHVYLVMKKGVDLKVGQLLTLFREVRTPESVSGARRPKGAIVAIKGSVKINQWDPKTRVARGVIVESLDVIERGTRVGPVGRRFDMVPPRTNQVDLWARILTSVYPHVFMAQHQIVFIDRGEKDGLAAGNRLLVVRRGDTWRRSLKTSTHMARDRLVLESAEGVEVEPTPLRGDEQTFPEEIMGEIRILRTRKDSSIAIVTVSHRELIPGDRAVARRGY